MIIEGPTWFVAAIVVCAVHALYLRGWVRERRAQLARWAAYDAASERRHVEFMQVLRGVNDAAAVQPHRPRGQA